MDFARDFALHFAWRAAAKSALGTGLGMLLLADFVVAKHTITGTSMQARPLSEHSQPLSAVSARRCASFHGLHAADVQSNMLCD